MGGFKGFLIGLILVVIASVISFQVAKTDTNKEIAELKKVLFNTSKPDGAVEQVTMKELTEKVKILIEESLRREQECTKLKKENDSLHKKLENTENYMAKLTDEFVKEGLKRGFSSDSGTKEKKDISKKSPEDLINEANKAIESQDFDTAFEAWRALLSLGPDYFAKAAEIYTAIEEKIIKKLGPVKDGEEIELSPEVTSKLFQQSMKTATKMMELVGSKDFQQFAEWIIDTKQDIKNNIETQALVNLSMLYLDKAPKVYDYLKEKISQSATEEDTKKYSQNLIPMLRNKDIVEKMFQDISNPLTDLKTQKSISYALGVGAWSLASFGGNTAKEKFEKAIENSPYKQTLQEEFEKAIKEEGGKGNLGIQFSVVGVAKDKNSEENQK